MLDASHCILMDNHPRFQHKELQSSIPGLLFHDMLKKYKFVPGRNRTANTQDHLMAQMSNIQFGRTHHHNPQVVVNCHTVFHTQKKQEPWFVKRRKRIQYLKIL